MAAHEHISKGQFPKLWSDEGGFSVNLAGESPTSGYMVAQKGHERSIPQAVSHPHQLEAYTRENEKALSKPGMYFGGYRDPELHQVDLDVTANLPSGGTETQSRARAAIARVQMVYHDQRSMYHVDTGNVIRNVHYGQKTGPLTPEERKQHGLR